MSPPPLAAATILVAASLLVGQPTFAQDTSGSSSTTPATPPASPPVSGQSAAPHLVVASVKLNGGWRASKFIGSAVFDDQNHKIGTVDDLVLNGQDQAAVAILSVGGFLGIGNKLVAIKFDQLHYDPTAKDAKVVMSGATKDTLAGMPNFTYTND